MKKSLKIVLIILIVVVFSILIDILSIYTRSKPIFAIIDKNEVYRGLFYDTYNCSLYSVPQVKAKWVKYNCSETDIEDKKVIIGKIIDIKDNYLVIVGVNNNDSIKYDEEAHIILSNKPKIKENKDLVVGDYIKISPISIQETYPVKVETNTIEVIRKNNDSMFYRIETEETINCNNRPKVYYNDEDRNIYTYCLDSIKISEFDKTYELKDYIKNHKEIIDAIISQLTHIDVLYDGGTSIFEDDKKIGFTNHGLTLIKCKTLEGNRDIYIGTSEMSFKNNFCKNKNNTFTRTYTIKDVKEYKGQQYENGILVTYGKSLEVTLSEFEKETKKIIINNLWESIEKGKTYEFEFYLYEGQSIEDSMESIFKNASIVSLKETSKTGLDQIREEIK